MKGRKESITGKELLQDMPYTKKELEALDMRKLKMLASLLGVDSWQKTKNEIVKSVYKSQHELELIDERIESFCEMCGNFVAIREKGHIVAEGGRGRINILMLCPSCHRMFDTRLKPRLYEALKKYGARKLPESWTKSIYYQAFEAAMASKKTKKN
ncbi:MAG: hypothetical protein JRJ86_17400 [Deltaproteobacteria bacterium]|nr:hypothetical protein [Deltaproteobacteria bacterium]MBW2364802.1 hypothetical protein [Deltaproteobacteria bacterium]